MWLSKSAVAGVHGVECIMDGRVQRMNEGPETACVLLYTVAGCTEPRQSYEQDRITVHDLCHVHRGILCTFPARADHRFA